jgi:hypothetical protein
MNRPRKRKPPLTESRAVAEVQHLLTEARGSVFVAFDACECGIDGQQAVEFLEGSLHFQSLPADQQGKVLGIALGFAMVAVESERIAAGAAEDPS